MQRRKNILEKAKHMKKNVWIRDLCSFLLVFCAFASLRLLFNVNPSDDPVKSPEIQEIIMSYRIGIIR